MDDINDSWVTIAIYTVHKYLLDTAANPIPRLYFAERPLREAHLQVLADTQSRTTNIQMQAGWACKSWTKQVADILGNVATTKTLDRLKFCEEPLGQEAKEAQHRDATLFVRLLCNLASTRSWSLAYLSETQPHNWFGILHSDVGEVRNSLAKVKSDATVVREGYQKMVEEDPATDKEAWSCFPMSMGCSKEKVIHDT